MIPGAGYLRVSSEKQGRDDRVSIPEQKRLIEERAKADGVEIVVWYADFKPYRSTVSNRMVQPSGTRADRPGFVGMLVDMREQRFRILYAWTQDRLGRGTAVITQVRDAAEAAGCEIRLVMGAWDADTAELLGAVAGLELRRIKQRMMMGRVGRFRKGLSNSRQPECYEIVRDGDGKSIGYRLPEASRELLHRIAELLIAGVPYHLIAEQTGRGVSWIVWAVNSTFLRGLVRMNGELRKGKHEPAWDAVTLAAMDKEIARRHAWSQSRPRRKQRGHVNVFAGLLRCAYCGGWMKSANQAERGKEYRLGYNCGRRYRGDHDHPPNCIQQTVLIRRWRELVDAFDDDTLAELVGGQGPADVKPDARLEKLHAQARELEAALEAVRSMPAAAKAIEADLNRVRLDIEAAAITQTPAIRQADEMQIREGVRQMRSAEFWRLEPDEIANHLRATIQELWIQDGRIVSPPA